MPTHLAKPAVTEKKFEVFTLSLQERENLKRCFDDRHHMQKGNLVRCQATGCQSRSSSHCKGCMMAFCAVKGKNCFASHHDPMFVKYINEHMNDARDGF